MVKIFISYAYGGDPTSLIVSDSREKVDIAHAAMSIPAHEVEEISLDDESFGIHNLAFILTSTEKQIDGKTVNIWRRGK